MEVKVFNNTKDIYFNKKIEYMDSDARVMVKSMVKKYGSSIFFCKMCNEVITRE